MPHSALSTPQPKRPKEAVSIWIRADKRTPHLFHCFDCKFPLFKYEGSVLMVVPGASNNPVEQVPGEHDFSKQVMRFPLIINCNGHSSRWGKCNMTYYIEQFVD